MAFFRSIAGLLDLQVLFCQRLSHRRPSRVCHLNDWITVIKRRWRKVLPNRSGWVDRDVVPHDAAAVMLTHQMRDDPAFVPELGDADVR